MCAAGRLPRGRASAAVQTTLVRGSTRPARTRYYETRGPSSGENNGQPFRDNDELALHLARAYVYHAPATPHRQPAFPTLALRPRVHLNGVRNENDGFERSCYWKLQIDFVNERSRFQINWMIHAAGKTVRVFFDSLDGTRRMLRFGGLILCWSVDGMSVFLVLKYWIIKYCGDFILEVVCGTRWTLSGNVRIVDITTVSHLFAQGGAY